MDAIRYDTARWWRDPGYRDFVAAVTRATADATATMRASVPPAARRAA